MGESAHITATWARYAETRDLDARNVLIEHYLPLVDRVVTQLEPKLARHAEHGDLVSHGTFGLIDAILKFNPRRGTKFTVFAWPRIRGQILDDLRTYDHVDRARRQLVRAVADLTTRLQRTPTLAEIAAELGLSPDGLDRLRAKLSITNPAVPLSTAIAVDNPAALESLLIGGENDPAAEWEINELREALADAWNSLPARQRTLLSLRYVEGLTFSEAAACLGIAPSWVSQVTTEALRMLREEVAKR